MARTKVTWSRLTSVESDHKRGVYYDIDVRNDGLLRCSCHSFRFAPGKLGTADKTCKHLGAYHTGTSLNIFKNDAGASSITTANETFTFRRAVMFGMEL